MSETRRAFPTAGARLGVAFLCVLSGVLVAVRFGPLWRAPLRVELALLLGGLGWAAALALAWRGTGPSRRALLLGALVLRLVALAGDPELSDDVYRYVFEGALVAEGKSPYAHAPASPERAAERARWAGIAEGVNHPEVSAAYPPWAQGVFALHVLAAGGTRPLDGPRAILALRIGFGLCDLLVLLLLLRLLERRGLPPSRAVAWGWSPLVALEFAGSAHFDVLALALLLGATLAVLPRETDRRQRLRAAAAGLLVAGATLVKLLPLLLVPFLARASRRAAPFAIGLVLTGVASLVPLALLEGGTRGLDSGLSEYALRWEAASLLHRFVEAPLARFLDADEGPTDPRRVARAVEGLALLAVLVLAWRRRLAPERAAFVLLGAFLLLTPTLHPWYVAWIVPWLAFNRSLAFGTLAVLAPWLYWPLAGWKARGEWIEPGWLWPLVALPFLVLWVVELRREEEPACPS